MSVMVIVQVCNAKCEEGSKAKAFEGYRKKVVTHRKESGVQ